MENHCDDTLDARVIRAMLHAATDNVVLAKSLLTEGIEARSEHDAARAYFSLGLILLGADQPREALAALMTATPWRDGRAPLLGEHTEAVLHELLGLDAGAVAALREAEAI